MLGTSTALLGMLLLHMPRAQAQELDYTFSTGSAEHYFPTTTGKYHIIDMQPAISGPGVHSVELEILADGYWPQQEGFTYGLAGYPLTQTNFHELGQFDSEWSFRGRDGRSYAEGTVRIFGSALKVIGDRIRLDIDNDTGVLRVYTRRVGTGEYVLEGGKDMLTGIAVNPGQALHFALAGICWQPCGVKIVSSKKPANSDGSLGAAAELSEPAALPITARDADTAAAVLDFTFADGGGGDGDPLIVTALALQVEGTLNPERLAFRLDGPDAPDLRGSYDADSGLLQFENLDIEIADGSSATYTVSAWFTGTDDISNGQTLMLALDSTTGVRVDATQTQMGASSSVDNGTGSVVSGINSPPVASGLSVSGTYIEGETLTGSYTYADVDDDDEGATMLQWERADDADGSGSAAIATATSAAYLVGADDVGKYLRFTVRPHDGTEAGDMVASAWTGPVLPANVAPQRSGDIDGLSATQDSAFSADLSPYFSDADSDTLAFTASGLPATLTMDAAGTISGTPDNAAALASPYTVTVTATDPDGAAASGSFELSVINVNDAPVASTAIGAQSGSQGTPFTLDVAAHFADIDGDALTFIASGLPANLVIDADGSISGTPDNAAALNSPHTVTVIATDPGNANASASFELTITNINDAPVLTSAFGAQDATVGTSFTLNAAAHFSDIDGDLLTFTATPMPDGLSISSAGLLAGTPTSTATPGSPYTITISATDPDGATAQGELTLTILPEPEPEPEPDPDPIVDTEQRGADLSGNIRVTPDGVVDGGSLTGNVTNAGTITGDVQLGAGTQITGGIVSGNISGDSRQPAVITDATLPAGTQLQNVVIGTGTVLDANVLIGPNVRFADNSVIPPGTALAAALPQLSWQDGDARPIPDLDTDVLAGDNNTETPNLLRSIQTLPAFEPAGNHIAQDGDTGELRVVTDVFAAAAVPAQVSQAEPDAQQGVFVDANGDLVFVTSTLRIVVAHPALVDSNAFATVLETLGLRLDFNARADLVVAPMQPVETEDGAAMRRMQNLSAAFYYSGRPGVQALPATRTNSEGLHGYPVDGLANVHGSVLTFRTADGSLMEQELVPVPADWLAFRRGVENIPGVESVRIDTGGLITVVVDGETVNARAGYVVLRDAAPGGGTDARLEMAYDLNGDGQHDYRILFPNGDAQNLFVYPP